MPMNSAKIFFLFMCVAAALSLGGCGNGFTRLTITHIVAKGDELWGVVFSEHYEDEVYAITAHGLFQNRSTLQSRGCQVFRWRMGDEREVKSEARHHLSIPMEWSLTALVLPPDMPGTPATIWSSSKAMSEREYRFSIHRMEHDREAAKWVQSRRSDLPVGVRAIFSERGAYALQAKWDRHVTHPDLVDASTGISILDEKQRAFLGQALQQVELPDVLTVTDDGRFVVFQKEHVSKSVMRWIDLKTSTSGEIGGGGKFLSAQSSGSGLLFAMAPDEDNPLERRRVVILDVAGTTLGSLNAGQRYEPMIAWDIAHDCVFTYRMESEVGSVETGDYRSIRIHCLNYHTGVARTATLECASE